MIIVDNFHYNLFHPVIFVQPLQIYVLLIINRITGCGDNLFVLVTERKLKHDIIVPDSIRPVANSGFYGGGALTYYLA